MTSRRKKAAQTKESILTAKLNQLALDIGKYGAYAAGVCAFVLFIRNLVYDVYGVCQEHTHDWQRKCNWKGCRGCVCRKGL